uniref:Calmodulin regulated spectrin-associated protein 1b n=1 Tax=Takifugu rubripes TaxID=31033 RepID=A0A674MT18_TAKRU
CVTSDLRDPFYTDQYDQEHIKPPVIHLLLSSELYCRVCSLILKTEQAASLQSHMSVIHSLSRKGIYVVESDDTPVADEDLSCMPIKMSAHMSMIDALMMAYTVEMISIEKVVASVKRFSTFRASKELPFDLEDAMVFWINKVNMKMREITEREHKVKHHPLESPSHQKSPSKWYWKLVPVRYRRDHASGRQLPFFRVLEDLMRDICDGAALLTLVHCYCPDLMKLEDICLKEVPSIADSLYNIQLLREFANEYLNKSFYLTIEDMLYSPLVLKHNIMVFIAELFWWFETVKPEFVQPRDLQEFKDCKFVCQPKCTRPAVPISNATKRSFLANPDNQNSPEVCNRYFLHPEDSDTPAGPSFSPSHPLLPLRQRQQKQQEDGMRNRSNSLTGTDGQPRGSVVAWPDKRQRPLSTLSPFMFHSATDGDVDGASGDSVSLARSISKDSLASNILNATPKHLPAANQPPQAAMCRVNGLHASVHVENEEETLAVTRTDASLMPKWIDATQPAATVAAKLSTDPRPAADTFYLEPLMPAALKTAKEKSVCLNKEEESGEGPCSSGWGSLHRGDGSTSAVRRKPPCSMNQTYPPPGEEKDMSVEPLQSLVDFRPVVTSSIDPSSKESAGVYLQSDSEESKSCQVMDTELEDQDEEEEDLDEAVTTKDPNWTRKAFEDDEEEESAKLQEDMNVKEHEDKDLNGGSGRSSPCLSTHSQASSMASGSVRMTSFAERKAQQQRFGSNHDLYSSATSSQRTTPDGSESSGPLNSWRLKRDQSPSSPMGGWSRTGDGGGSANVLASELVQLHMQLEEKRRAIEHQKKKRDLLMARQRQKLGKAAFLNIVKKDGGRSDAFPNPLKADIPKDELGGEKAPPSKELMCAGTQKGDRELEGTFLPGALEADEKENNGNFCPDEELDPYECSRSIEQLNEAINSIQQQMMQVSLKQELLIKQNVQSPPGASPTPPLAAEKNGDSKAGASFHFVDHVSGSSTVPTRKPPKLSSSRGSRSKPSELKLGKEQSRVASKALHPAHSGSKTLPQTRHLEGGRSPKRESPRTPVKEETAERPGDVHTTFRLNDEANIRLPTRVDLTAVAAQEVSFEECLSSTMKESELNSSDGSGRENIPSEVPRSKAPLIEVDLSELKSEEDEAVEDANSEGGEGEQKSVLGFFFKDDRKAEGDLAKKKAAFLLKQQKKAEEARLRRQQLEAESELKRDEARRKAEEDRLRKEEEKMRRELIKQEYQQRKQQEMFEEQKLSPKLFKPKTPKPKQRPRPKSVLREESSIDVSKDSSTPDNLSNAQSGSSLSLASAATNEADSLKLFKEPSAKSNKPIIHNAISHCCLAGKVNEPQKKQILEELEKCESNHLMILFRDSGCQFRALYSYFPDTEEILKLTGTGPKSISKKMIDKLYKYNSDRKQFTVIPAKTVSVSVDAITIHNHLWQAKKTSVPKKNGK